MQYVQRFRDEHIVKLIKAYGHGESINLIFPRASTNLDLLLRDRAFEYSDKRGPRLELADAWTQLLGVCLALKKIHGSSDENDTHEQATTDRRVCIHFGLKPDNILVDQDTDNWLITDFGQAALI